MLAPGIPPPPPPDDPPLGIRDPPLWPLEPPLGMPLLGEDEPDEPDDPDEPPGRLGMGMDGPCGPWEGELELQPATVSNAHSPKPQARLRRALGRVDIGLCCIVAMIGILAPYTAHLTAPHLNRSCIGSAAAWLLPAAAAVLPPLAGA